MPWNLYKVELDELIEVSNEEERKYFYSELDKTQIFTKDIIEFIKNQYVNYLKYKENLITKEQLQANDEKFKNFFLDKKEIKLLKKEKI